MGNWIYVGIGVVAGIGLAIFGIMDLQDGQSSATGNFVWAAVAFAAAGVLTFLQIRKQRREVSAVSLPARLSGPFVSDRPAELVDRHEPLLATARPQLGVIPALHPDRCQESEPPTPW